VSSYEHTPHPYTKARLTGQTPPPAKVDDERVGLNGRICDPEPQPDDLGGRKSRPSGNEQGAGAGLSGSVR